jgi:hypothetical protein
MDRSTKFEHFKTSALCVQNRTVQIGVIQGLAVNAQKISNIS